MTVNAMYHLHHSLKCTCRALALVPLAPLRPWPAPSGPSPPAPRSRLMSSVPPVASSHIVDRLKGSTATDSIPSDLDALESRVGQLLSANRSSPSSLSSLSSSPSGGEAVPVSPPVQPRFSAADVVNELSKANLKRPNTAAVGLSFELRTVHVLNSYQPFIVEHTGKSGDQGIDFQGYLTSQALHSSLTSSTPPSPLAPHLRHHPTLAADPSAIPVLGQCKALSRPVSPGQIHGFAAVLAARNLRARTTACAPFLGVFVCEDRGFTKGSRRWVVRECPEPMVLIALRQAGGDNADAVQEVVVNEVARRVWPRVRGERWRVGVEVGGGGFAHRLVVSEQEQE